MPKETSSCGAIASQDIFKGQVEQTFPSGGVNTTTKQNRCAETSATLRLLNPVSRNRVRERLTLGRHGCCNPYLTNKPSGMHLRNPTAKPTWTLSNDQNRSWPPYSNKTTLWMWPAPPGPPFPSCVSDVLVTPAGSSFGSWWLNTGQHDTRVKNVTASSAELTSIRCNSHII